MFFASTVGISWREPQRKFLLHKDMTDITAPYSIVADSPYIWVIFGGNGTDAAVWRGHLNKLMPVAIEGTMHTKGIESIIILELLLYYSYHEEADDGGNDTDAEGSENIGTAGCRSDGYQSGNSTGTSTYRSWLLVYNPVDEHPGGSCCSCGDMDYKEGIGCHDEYRLHQDAENILLAHQTTIIMC